MSQLRSLSKLDQLAETITRVGESEYDVLCRQINIEKTNTLLKRSSLKFRQMEKVIGIETDFGIINGRDGIYLDSVESPNETEIVLKGEFNTSEGFKKYGIRFYGIIFTSSIELDFDERGQMESFGSVQNSEKVNRFRELDHSSKLKVNHQHFYFRTYDTVFEIIAEGYEWL